MKNTQEFIRYANSFQTVIHLSLQRILALLEYVGNPQDKLQVIHVAGTNGKGSVCSFLQSILTVSGKKTGKYISPNLLRVNERISVDGTDISDDDLKRLLHKIESYVPKVKEKVGEIPSQFEIWTAVAFCYFLEQNCDIVILETGLGGRFDATNVVNRPIATVITRIAVDHTAYLGDTLSKIAFEKAGIIKSGAPLITLPQETEAMETLAAVANEKHAEIILTKTPAVHLPKGHREVFSYGAFHRIESGLMGYHQIENACLAIETALTLKLSSQDIIKGIRMAKNPGRLELLDDRLLFDGAHNLNGMSALKYNLDRYYPDTPKIFVSAFMRDKDILSSLGVFRGETFCFTTVKENERAELPETLCTIGKQAGVYGIAFSDLEGALSYAKDSGRLIVVCGSLYLYKDLWEIL